MRVRVIDVLELLAAGQPAEKMLADFPYPERDDIAASRKYAARRLDRPREQILRAAAFTGDWAECIAVFSRGRHGRRVAVSGCLQPIPPGPPVERQATAVTASFGRTWDSVIDVFAERNIPIRTIDRSSGFIATEALSTSAADTLHADCGIAASGLTTAPTSATYNVVVRGDSAASMVKVTVRWSLFSPATGGGMLYSPASTLVCSTRGRWEDGAEREIKERAEGRASPSNAPRSSPPSAPEPAIATRTFTDATASTWTVVERTTPGYERLEFTAGRDVRDLHPIPDGWRTAGQQQLREYLARSVRVTPP